MNKDICELLEKFEITPHEENIELYEMAFTHSSFNNDANTVHHDYERLEFMGDSIIGFVVADLAFTIHPDMSQGEMTKLRASIVQGPSLAEKAREFNFADYIKTGKSIKYDINGSKKLMEDVFEAFIGAVYFDQGVNYAYDLVYSIFENRVREFKMEDVRDYKTKLQEIIAARHKIRSKNVLDYHIIKEEGPAHCRSFTIEVRFDGITFGIGEGKSKKEAEQRAAKMALEKMVK